MRTILADGSKNDLGPSHLQRENEPTPRSTVDGRVGNRISKVLRCRFAVPTLQLSSISCLFVNTESERGTATG